MTLDIEKINKKFVRYVKNDNIPGLTTFLFSANSAEQINIGEISKGTGPGINNDTLFEIGSLTKPIIASLYSILESKKTIDLQKSISYYLKGKYELSPIFDEFKIEDILTHTSGLPRLPAKFFSKMNNSDNPYSVLTRDDMATFFIEPEGITRPGRYNYSNLGYGILGEILKTVFSPSLDELAGTYLFAEANMTRTGTIARFSGDKNIATGYTSKNQVSPLWTGDVLEGAGSFLSTNNDMAKFLKLNLGYYDTPITQAILRTHIQRTKNTGLGWHFKKGILPKLLGYSGFTWHNGMTGGFSSYMAFDQKKKSGIVLMANKATLLDSYFYYYSSFVR
jgi:serine-type D-Ala-D-Ala carboxypeptidase/endopeptidase